MDYGLWLILYWKELRKSKILEVQVDIQRVIMLGEVKNNSVFTHVHGITLYYNNNEVEGV